MQSLNVGPMIRCSFLLLVLLAATTTSARAQIYQVKDLNTVQLRAFDRGTTVVVLPGGILEQHGPYLPSFTDGYRNERLTQELANAIVERPGWKVLVFPMIPLGSGGANQIGGKYSFEGTYAVRSATLRDVFMDLATELGEQGFRWVFVVHCHGNPNHQVSLDQAGDYFRDTYRGQMVNLFGLVAPQFAAAIERLKSDDDRQDDQSATEHAGMRETSELLFLRPDLVDSNYQIAPPYRAPDRTHMRETAAAPNWPGYFGSPRRATAAFGAMATRLISSLTVDLALSILDGFDYRQLRRLGDTLQDDPVVKAALANEAERARRQMDWLRSKGKGQ